MDDKKIYELLSNISKALASPIRIEIIAMLDTGEMNFGDIQKKIEVSKSNLSQHLSVMVSNGLVEQRREGTNTYFRLSSTKVAIACQMMKEVLIDNLNSKISLLI